MRLGLSVFDVVHRVCEDLSDELPTLDDDGRLLLAAIIAKRLDKALGLRMVPIPRRKKRGRPKARKGR